MTPIKQQGFTLVEVMVALAILAVVGVAASQASSSYIKSVDGLRTRTLAHFVAQNMAVQLQIQKAWLTKAKTENLTQQGRNWTLTYTPSKTLTPNIQSVTINVRESMNENALSASASQAGNTNIGEPQANVGIGTGTEITIMLTNPNSKQAQDVAKLIGNK